MKVFLTSQGEYSSRMVTGVFSTVEKAEAAILAHQTKSMRKRHTAWHEDIEEFEVDWVDRARP